MTGAELASFETSREDQGRDEEISAAVRDDPAAFELLYRRHYLAVFRYLRARTQSDDEAVELTAVVFEQALRAIGRYRPSGGGILAWLFTIARNAAHDAGRSRRRRSLFSFQMTDSEPDPPDQRLAEDGLLERERLAELRARVSRLPEIQREAIQLRYAGGLTAGEIGAALGKSEAAAQKMLSRALVTLREAYRDDK